MPAENRPEARRLLEARAMAALEGGELASLSRQRIRLWEYPAFADYSSWIVQDAGAGGSAPETYTAH